MNIYPILGALKRKLNAVNKSLNQGSYLNQYSGRTSESYQFYLKEIKDNLFELMNMQHQGEYNSGNGSELLDKQDEPAKMKAIRSSSAMTFNILGNDNITILKNNHGIQLGNYSVEFEKKLLTLKRAHLAPATLDACLLSEDKQTVIFCEMKMMEYLQPKAKPELDSYLDRERYYDDSCFNEFRTIFDRLKNQDIKKYYDDVQMMKHILGIYNAMFSREADCKSSLSGKYPEFKDVKEIKLVNCVWEISGNQNNGGDLKEYFTILDQMHNERDKFLQQLTPIKNIYRSSLGVNFEVVYLNHSDFIKLIKMSNDRVAYLERYQI